MIWALLACTPSVLQEVDLLKPQLRADAKVLGEAMRALPEQRSGGPSVVIIVLDTLRADHLGSYGDTRNLMPKLDAFAEKGRVYSEMQSVAPWTLPSHASLFTGMHAISHGAHGTPPGSTSRGLRLGTSKTTLAERFKSQGYTTVGIAANRAFLDSRWGLGRGFDLWLCEQLESVPGQGYLQANRVVALSQQFMAERGDGKTLLFLNFMEAHTPWIPREGYVEDPSVIDIMHLPTGLEWAGDRHRFAPITTQVNNGKRDATRAERASWEAAYASELRYLDDQLGELFEVLKDNGHDFEKDYTIILSDHGEFLGEHRLVEHSKALYKQVSDVPLIVRGPGISPGVDPEPVQTSDVPNLLLGWMGMAPLTGTPETELQISEMYWARRKNRSSAAQTLRFDHLQRSFTLGNHRLVLQDDGQHMAFDLAADPGEYDNLYGKAQWVPEMERLGQAWLVGQSYGEQVEVGAMSQAQEDALRALGYVE